MTNIQAALGCGQLKNINWIINRKREIGNLYYNKLKNCKNIFLQKNKTNYAKNIYWVFGIVLKKDNRIKRDMIMKKLRSLKIDTRPFFYPMHKQKIFKKLKIFNKNKFLNSEYLSNNGFYLPSGLGIKNKEIDYIIKKILKIL